MASTILSLSLLAVTAVHASPIKLPRAEESGKRGVAFNNGEYLDLFPTDGPKFSWCYNWAPSFDAPEGLEFIPLLHGNKPEFTNNWVANFEKAVEAGSKEVFSFNEPDQCGDPKVTGGSCIPDVGIAADAYRTYIQKPVNENAKLKNVRKGAPSVTNGDAPKGKDYLERFLNACSDCDIDFLNAHWYASATPNAYYDPLEKFKTQITDIHKLKPDVPVYVTEFGFDAGSDQEKQTALKRIMAWMDEPEQDWIERYAYHMAAPQILLNPEGTALSALGSVYASS